MVDWTVGENRSRRVERVKLEAGDAEAGGEDRAIGEVVDRTTLAAALGTLFEKLPIQATRSALASGDGSPSLGLVAGEFGAEPWE
jgi:hypothetical protein